MQVGDPTQITSAFNPAQISPVRPAVRQNGDGRAAERGGRDGARDGGTSFRATLDATVPDGIVAQLPTQQRPQSEFAAEAPRPEKRPDAADTEIDGVESARLFADKLNAHAESPKYDGASEIPTSIAQQHRSVAHQYAKRFFSAGGTFAARGDKLEVSA